MEYVKAFIVGGLICVVGQIILDNTKLTPAHILVSFLTAGVILGGIGLYEPLVKFGGAGATVPIIGFGNALAQGAIEGAKTKGIIGAFTGGLQATAGGVAAAILFGYIMAVIFNPKRKTKA
ncbi:stage V sporulation protein AE [Tissierella carlieri]|uniref:stage V sporulation protein AE n=1 Tax=Tissierella carlieri TaxID=689904 RepID=UPI00386D5437